MFVNFICSCTARAKSLMRMMTSSKLTQRLVLKSLGKKEQEMRKAVVFISEGQALTSLLVLFRSVRWFQETQTSAVKSKAGSVQPWFHGIITRRLGIVGCRYFLSTHLSYSTGMLNSC